jgi:transposase
MIPAGARVLVATKPVDFRKGPEGLTALVRDAGADPFSGALYVFRSKRADRVKIVWWDGTGLCLFSKRLDEDRLAADGADRRHGLDPGPRGPPAEAGLGRLIRRNPAAG